MRFVLCLAVAASIAGCAMTVQLPASTAPKLTVSPAAAKQVMVVVDGSNVSKQSKDWEQFRGEWRTACEMTGKEKGISVAYKDSVAAATSAQPATLAVVNINDYRYITQGARAAVGIMTGNAFVDADVAFIELPGNANVGSRKYNVTSAASQGIFSPMTEAQLKAICDALVNEVVQR